MSNKLGVLEDNIGRRLAESVASGELQQAAGYGKPLDLGDGYQETPEELRMGYKMLKDAGFVPPEVELMKRVASLRAKLAGATEVLERPRLERELLELELSLSVIKDRLGGGRIR